MNDTTPLIGSNTISIHASPDKVWDALVNPSKTKLYMYGCETESDWQVGSKLDWKMQHEGADFIAVTGIIKALTEQQQLSYTTVDPHAEVQELPENHLVVSYSLTVEGQTTLLTVTQGDYAKVNNGQARYEDKYVNTNGWQPLLEAIKSLVEATA